MPDGIMLPTHQAKQLQAQAALAHLRLQTATQLLAPLLADTVRGVRAAHAAKCQTYPKYAEENVRVEIDLQQPVAMALQAADQLLIATGMVAPGRGPTQPRKPIDEP